MESKLSGLRVLVYRVLGVLHVLTQKETFSLSLRPSLADAKTCGSPPSIITPPLSGPVKRFRPVVNHVMAAMSMMIPTAALV